MMNRWFFIEMLPSGHRTHRRIHHLRLAFPEQGHETGKNHGFFRVDFLVYLRVSSTRNAESGKDMYFTLLNRGLLR